MEPKPVSDEDLTQTQECWLNLSPAVTKVTDQFLESQGLSMYTVHEAIKIDSDRISQVQVATIAALATMTVDYMQSTQKVQPLPIRTSVISLDDGNEALLLIRQKDASSDVYATHRANLLSYTNDLLRIFNQPPLPSYTSQSRTEIDGHY